MKDSGRALVGEERNIDWASRASVVIGDIEVHLMLLIGHQFRSLHFASRSDNPHVGIAYEAAIYERNL